jgi:MFS family permease
MGANLLAASNVINAMFRVMAGYAGDRLGRQNTLVLTLMIAASSVFAF